MYLSSEKKGVSNSEQNFKKHIKGTGNNSDGNIIYINTSIRK